MNVAPRRGNLSSLPMLRLLLPLKGIIEQSIECFGFHRPAPGRFCSGLAACDFTPSGHWQISPGPAAACNARLPLYVSRLPKTQKYTKSFTDGYKLAAAFSSQGAVRGLQCPPPPQNLPRSPPGAQRRLWNRAIKSESVVQHSRKKTPRGGSYAGLLLQFSTVTDGEGRDVGQNDAFG